MVETCKTCGGSGWVNGDLKSDAAHSKLIEMGVDFEIACTDCDAGRAALAKARAEAKVQWR